MRNILISALLAAALATPLAAQNSPAPAANSPQAGDTAADRVRGAVIFRTFSMALNSDKVQPAVKNQLVGCLYNNPMKKISMATGQVFEKNKNLDPKKPEQVYAVAAQLCGVKPQTAQNASKAPAKTAAKSSN